MFYWACYRSQVNTDPNDTSFPTMPVSTVFPICIVMTIDAFLSLGNKHGEPFSPGFDNVWPSSRFRASDEEARREILALAAMQYAVLIGGKRFCCWTLRSLGDGSEVIGTWHLDRTQPR